jgi:nucleoside 2-deoxyribosyltransferase
MAPIPVRGLLVPLEDVRQRAAWLKDKSMPKFYLATRKDRAAQAEKIVEALKSHGWERTFTWTGDDKAGTEAYSELAEAELSGVCKADVLIVLLPGGYGTHVEIGAALALGKRVIIHASDQKTLDTPYPCVFHYHPGVKLIVSEVVDANAIVALAFQQECLIPGPVELLGKTYVSER